MRFHKTATLLAVVPAVLGLAACGEQAPTSSASPTQQPATPSVTPSATPPVAPQQAAVRLDRATFVPAASAAMEKQKTWRVTSRMSLEGVTMMTMTGTFRSEPFAASSTMSGQLLDGKTMKFLLIGKTAYVQMPGATPPGKWGKTTLTGAAGKQLAELSKGADASQLFAQLKPTVKQVRFVRSEQVAGQQLNRYSATVDSAAAAKLAGEKLEAGAPKTLTYTFWLDSANLVRRVSFKQSGMDLLMTFDNFNRPVSITAPPASKVIAVS